MREDIWVDELNFESYQNNEIDFIDDSGKSCCVHSITDYTKQVRKEVCEEIRDKLKDMDFLAHETELGERIDCFSKYKVLDILIRVEDQIQGE